MQLEHILQAHGLIGRGGGKEIPLPEVNNFIATQEVDGLGIVLTWENSTLSERTKTEIFASVTDLNGADYDYCTQNTTKIADVINDEEYTYKDVIAGTKYFFKAFMTFDTLGEIRINKGVTTSAIAPYLPSIISFTAQSKDDGTGIILDWVNSSMAEYNSTQLFVSINNIANETYEYCTANTTKIVDSNTLSTFLYEDVAVGTTYYFKIFMLFDISGEIKANNGKGTNVTVVDIVPPATITNFLAKADNGQVTLTWVNPSDSDFSKVKILYKQGDYPTLPIDGTVAYEGSGNTVTVTGLTNDVEYYFRAFIYDTSGNINDITNNQQITAIPSDGDDKTGSPGSKKLIAGTMEEGFFGEVPSSDLITGDALASQVGISQGTSQHSTAGWLKFARKGNVQFVAKKPIRNSISWDAINTAKCVYGDSGDKTVEIGGLVYKVRLLRALEPSNDPKTIASANSGTVNHGSEWNRLMCQIHEQAIDKSWDYPANVESDIGILEHNLGNGAQGMYNDADLVVKSGDGRLSWCQEIGTSTSYRLGRGRGGVSDSYYNTSSRTDSNYGWRPCLELVP